MTAVGVLLAGGRSRRFGREKAVAPYGAGLLMDGPLQALAAACSAVAVSAPPGSGASAIAEACDYPVLPDPQGVPQGPLAGILAGLVWAKAQGAAHLVTAPCDAPLLRDRQLAALLRQAQATGEAAVAVSAGGLEPLIAVWPVQDAHERVIKVLATGRHPAVRTLLAQIGLTSVAGFDDVNVNEAPQLAALETATEERCPPHARLFRFEDDFVRTLRCIPMCIRFKLDRVAIKLSLKQWSRFTLDDRLALRRRACDTSDEIAAYRAALVALIDLRVREPAKTLAEDAPQGWRSPTTPPEIAAFAHSRGLASPSDPAWVSLTDLERYALVKLTRDKHENANFRPALEEFGLL